MISAATDARAQQAWEDATANVPCPVCWRSDGCRVADALTACLWVHTHFGRRNSSSDGEGYTLYQMERFRYIPAVEVAVALLLKHFFCRTDLVAFEPPWDATACPASGDEALPHLLRAHVGGAKTNVPWKTARKEGLTKQRRNWRIGSYSPAPDGTTCWVVADFDGGSDHAAPLADTTAVALDSYRRFWRAGVAAYLERSRSCSGWHLWVFFASPIAAAKARALAYRLLPDDTLTMEGEVGEIEVFPKRDNLDGLRVGNQVWLPWYSKAVPGGNVFYYPRDGRLVPFIPEMIEVVTEQTVDAVLGGRNGR